MITTITGWFNHLLEQRQQWHFENGYGAACVQILLYDHPVEFVRETVVQDGANIAFDDGWHSACNDLEKVICQQNQL